MTRFEPSFHKPTVLFKKNYSVRLIHEYYTGSQVSHVTAVENFQPFIVEIFQFRDVHFEQINQGTVQGEDAITRQAVQRRTGLFGTFF